MFSLLKKLINFQVTMNINFEMHLLVLKGKFQNDRHIKDLWKLAQNWEPAGFCPWPMSLGTTHQVIILVQEKEIMRVELEMRWSVHLL